MDRAIELCATHHVCVQAGGHVGLWPARLARTFRHVYTFEPDRALYACLCRNSNSTPQVIAHAAALGASSGVAKLKSHPHSGQASIHPSGAMRVRQMTIDELGLSSCDAIFLDIEGYEVEALKGARETIKKFRPVLHVEELGWSKARIREHMTSIGYELVAKIHRDAVYLCCA